MTWYPTNRVLHRPLPSPCAAISPQWVIWYPTLPVDLRWRERDLGVLSTGLVQTPGPAVLRGTGGPHICGVWPDVSGGWVGVDAG